MAPAESLTAKTLRVLGAFTAAAPELTLSQVAARTGLPLATAFRIVRDLTAWGALERGEDGRYAVGLRLWEVAALARRGLPVRETALPYMHDLYEITRESVQLAVREGTELVYIERLTGLGAVQTRVRVAGRFALHATGVGLVLLAYSPREVQEEVLAGPLPRWTAATVCDPRELRRLLAEVRHRGYARSVSQVQEDAVSLACPVRGSGGTVVAALSLIVPEDREDGGALLVALRTAARAVSRELGHVTTVAGGGT